MAEPKTQDKEQRKALNKNIATNRKASFNYELGEQFEAGLVLMGSEIKSLRESGCSLTDGYVHERNGEMWLMEVHISEYVQSGTFGHTPLRPRKLLLHKKEIARLLAKVHERGYSIIPTRVYFKEGRAKVEIALARGKKQYDKRDALAEKDSRRDIQRALKERDRE